MKHIKVPEAVQIKHRDGTPLREERFENGQLLRGENMKPLTFFKYADTWWNSESLASGGYKKRKQVENIIDAFDKAEKSGALYVSLENADYDLLKPEAEKGAYFKVVHLEIQCFPFVEAILEAKAELPAVLAPNGTTKEQADALG